jgi:cell division septal protein FtsQ
MEAKARKRKHRRKKKFKLRLNENLIAWLLLALLLGVVLAINHYDL